LLGKNEGKGYKKKKEKYSDKTFQVLFFSDKVNEKN